ncbi:hypothetical protein DBR18_25280 [Pseudomonas sp. HMWF021]|nr:hypothetical protein DBR18_25280 [Pseudomonas sp. HMWF021]
MLLLLIRQKRIAPCRSCRRLRSFDFKKQDQKIAACGSSYTGARLPADSDPPVFLSSLGRIRMGKHRPIV